MPRSAGPRPPGFRPLRSEPTAFGRGTAARFRGPLRKSRTLPEGLKPLLIILALTLAGIILAVMG
jgi:hypothetical protein